MQNLPRAPPRGEGNFSFFGVFLCESLDLLLFKTGNFSNKFPWGRKFDRSTADSAPLHTKQINMVQLLSTIGLVVCCGRKIFLRIINHEGNYAN